MWSPKSWPGTRKAHDWRSIGSRASEHGPGPVRRGHRWMALRTWTPTARVPDWPAGRNAAQEKGGLMRSSLASCFWRRLCNLQIVVSQARSIPVASLFTPRSLGHDAVPFWSFSFLAGLMSLGHDAALFDRSLFLLVQFLRRIHLGLMMPCDLWGPTRTHSTKLM